ncbi:cation:proton antiporter family protein [Flocculibacter collagenilyticus]|uniref:cation:proton antiporter family protein n=1 Tax=Flocculibacter collagenilyticus TaxID=2744479 RepID=UPI0018F5532E|nr:cation:proton antiporter family protein [Flocculibacter collagenilyticus]
MELIFFATAFVCGFVVLQLNLPPLIGFLVAGFVLKLAGFESTILLEQVSALGVTILLFSIGLKLKVKSLAKVQVWGPASLHITVSTLLFSGAILGLSYVGLPLFTEISPETSLILGFALSFSSTVFAVKVLEERGEMASMHGKIAIGILVMQDVFAVLFLAISTGKTPNVFALGLLILLPVLRPVLFLVLNRSKHGEVLPLLGFFLALIVGYHAFEFAGIKGDLGALIVGMLFASHNKASELAKSLLHFKDFLLVGFFLTIGLNASLSMEALIAACIVVLLLPIKSWLYFYFLKSFKLRARTSLLSTFSLSNYSEFGLIVCALAASNQWITSDWLAVIAVAVAITFIIASPLNAHANEIYVKYEPFWDSFESKERLPEEKPVSLARSKVLIFGMGRIGRGAYETLIESYPQRVTGVDINPDCVSKHVDAGRFVVLADATDPDFWQNINHSDVEMVLLSMPKHAQNVYALEQLKASGFNGRVSAIAFYSDQQRELEKMGVDSTFNFYLEAGTGFAEHVKATWQHSSSR